MHVHSFHILFSHNCICLYSFEKPCYTPRILGRRFALTSTAYKYLDIGISVGSDSFVEIILGDNKGSQIILSRATWAAFIERRVDIERLLQSTTAASSISICDLVIKLTTLYNTNVVKLISRDTCMYMKPSTVLFLFEIEHCVEHVYLWLCQNTQAVSNKFKHFVCIVQRNCVTNKSDAVKILQETCDKNSLIDCELLAFALDNILYDALH